MAAVERRCSRRFRWHKMSLNFCSIVEVSRDAWIGRRHEIRCLRLCLGIVCATSRSRFFKTHGWAVATRYDALLLFLRIENVFCALSQSSFASFRGEYLTVGGDRAVTLVALSLTQDVTLVHARCGCERTRSLKISWSSISFVHHQVGLLSLARRTASLRVRNNDQEPSRDWVRRLLGGATGAL